MPPLAKLEESKLTDLYTTSTALQFLIGAHYVLLYASSAFAPLTDSYLNAQVTAVQVSRSDGHVKNLDQNFPAAQRMLARKVH